MDVSRNILKLANLCAVLVMTLGSSSGGHPCPPGQLAHNDTGVIRCCLPVDCELHHYVYFCTVNGTSDTCQMCPSSHKLFKRTSSFAVENCHPFPLDAECKPTPGPLKPTAEDRKNCYCRPEKGWYFLEPENWFDGIEPCQPIIPRCDPGYQPDLNGDCQKCPRGTVQDESNSVTLCRPQRSCARLGLETVQRGTASEVEVCAKPPPPLTPKPSVPTSRTTSEPPSTFTTTTVAVPADTNDPKVWPSLDVNSAGSPSVEIIIAASCGGVLLLALLILIFIGHKKQWCAHLCKRRLHDAEMNAQPDLPMPNRRNENDNGSDNSCCACADSCLSASSKPGGSNSGKSGPSNSNGAAKQPLPALEAHWNGQYMNGKVCSGSPGQMSYSSEPLYNSISHDGSKISDGNMATYKNVQGGRMQTATMLKQDDFYGYPNKVHLPSDEDDDDSLKKGMHILPSEPRKPGENKDSEDCTEKDPLLPNEDISSRNGTPLMVPMNRAVDEAAMRGGGDGARMGNRPHLSMLLTSVEDRNPAAEDPPPQNLPYFSQLMSAASSNGGQGAQVSDRQQQLQQLLQQQLHEGASFPARLIPGVPVTTAARHPVNTSAVEMEELKPVMPLNPNPGFSSEGESPRVQGGRGSPARIRPSRQEEVPRKGAREVTPQRPVQAAWPTNVPVAMNLQGGAAVAEVEETFRKEVMPLASPQGGSEDTGRKSVGGSSGLGESLDISSPISMPSDLDGRQSRAPYRRSISEASRSVSPSPVPLPRSISSPEEKHRNVAVAVVKPMQSDQSLNNLQHELSELTQPLDSAVRHYPQRSARVHGVRRESSQDSSTDDPDVTRPKTPDRLSEEEDEGDDNIADDTETDERTRATFYGSNDSNHRDGRHGDSEGKDKATDRGSEG